MFELIETLELPGVDLLHDNPVTFALINLGLIYFLHPTPPTPRVALTVRVGSELGSTLPAARGQLTGAEVPLHHHRNGSDPLPSLA